MNTTSLKFIYGHALVKERLRSVHYKTNCNNQNGHHSSSHLWATTPTAVTHQILFTIHNSGKITVRKWQQDNFVMEGHPTGGAELKGCSVREVESGGSTMTTNSMRSTHLLDNWLPALTAKTVSNMHSPAEREREPTPDSSVFMLSLLSLNNVLCFLCRIYLTCLLLLDIFKVLLHNAALEISCYLNVYIWA